MPEQFRKLEGPSEEEWSKHRKTVEKLYIEDSLTLNEVRENMRRCYNFNATPQMYKKRFKKWNIAKNWKSTKKDQLLHQLSNTGRDTSSSTEVLLDASSRRKLKRHIRNMASKSQKDSSVVGEYHNPEAVNRNEPADLKPIAELSTLLTPRNIRNSSVTPDTPLGLDSERLRGARTRSNKGYRENSSAVLGRPMNYSPQLSRAELIFKNVSTFTTSETTYHSLSSLDSPFWDNLGCGIYFLKVGSPDRAWPVIQKACDTASVEIKSNAGAYILGVFTVLSPANTAICPALRNSLLRFLYQLAETFLSNNHPLAALARELRVQNGDLWITETALACLIDGISSAFGPAHQLSLTAQLRRVAFLRRSHKYDSALQHARTTLNTANSSYGPTSLQARRVARHIEHILMDKGSWAEALSVCLGIVGTADERGLPVETTLRDSCAVYTMEDIAKIYENMGEPEKSTDWLRKAATCATNLGKPVHEIAHIVDKLETLLLKSGRADEAQVWRRMAPRSLDP
ncbi:Clr5 domain-containing protein [Biscogniauxia mediterranea]|nr:Clr5 domain-containing protein [Biscogniauxia mediterranea]